MYSKFKNTFTDTILSFKIKLIRLEQCGAAMLDLESKWGKKDINPTNLEDWWWKGNSPHIYPEVSEHVPRTHFSCYIIKDVKEIQTAKFSSSVLQMIWNRDSQRKQCLYCLSHANQSTLICKNSVSNGFQIDLVALFQMRNMHGYIKPPWLPRTAGRRQ